MELPVSTGAAVSILSQSKPSLLSRLLKILRNIASLVLHFEFYNYDVPLFADTIALVNSIMYTI